MQIALKQTGGLLPLKKEAVADAPWTEDELEDLLAVIETRRDPHSPARDALYHTLTINERDIPIDITKVPAPYQPFFDNLRKKMKVVK